MDRTMDILEADEIINKKVQFLIDVNDLSNGENEIEHIVKTENLALDNLADDNQWPEINDFGFLNLGYGLEVEVEATRDVAIYQNLSEIDHQNNIIGLNIGQTPDEDWGSENSSSVNNEQEFKYVVLPEVRVLLDRQAVSNYMRSKETLGTEQIEAYPNETVEYVTDQIETEQYVIDQNETDHYVTDQNETEQYVTDQNETIQYVTDQNETEEYITDQIETEEYITDQNETEEYITDQNETEEYITDQNETEEYITDHNETEHYETEQYEVEQYETEQYESELNAKYPETLDETKESDLNTTCNETWIEENNDANAKYTVIATKEVAEINASTNLIKLYCKNCDKAHKRAFQNGYQNLTNCPSCQNPLVFQCAKCHESSRFLKFMQDHVLTLCGQQFNYQCNQCKLISKNKNRILNHIKKVHTAVERSGDFECYKCQKRIKYHRNLTRHQKICGVKKGFKCKVCLTRIKDYDDYRNHLLTHFPEQEKEFVDVDQSNLSLLKSIKTENSSLNGEYSFIKDSSVHLPISSLQNSFSNGHENEMNEQTKKKQKKSETSYSKTKHFFCDDCDQRCTTKASLELHIEKIHVKLNIKPDADGNFLCPKCNKKHQGARKFSNHHRSCSLPKVFKCKFCSYRLSKKDYLRTHMKNKHPEIDTDEREKVLNEIEKAVKRKMQANNKDVKVPKKVRANKVYEESTKLQKIEEPENVQKVEQPKKLRKVCTQASKVQKVCVQRIAAPKVYEPAKLEMEPKLAVKVEHVYQQEPVKVFVPSVKIENAYQPSIKVEPLYQASNMMVENVYDTIFLHGQLNHKKSMSKEQIMNVIGVDYPGGYIYDADKERSICYNAY